jgi:hypothetical protein
LVTWTSRGADGSGLGISGRLISNRGLPVGDEVVFNSSKANDQSHAAVAKTPAGYRVVWSALTGIDSGVDIYGRMFNKVSTVTAGRLKISWQSYPGVRYRLESSPDLALWSQEAGVVTAVANQSSVALDPAATSAKFFRISIVR